MTPERGPLPQSLLDALDEAVEPLDDKKGERLAATIVSQIRAYAIAEVARLAGQAVA